MKKLLALALSLVMVLPFAACGGETDAGTTGESDTTAVASDELITLENPPIYIKLPGDFKYASGTDTITAYASEDKTGSVTISAATPYEGGVETFDEAFFQERADKASGTLVGVNQVTINESPAAIGAMTVQNSAGVEMTTTMICLDLGDGNICVITITVPSDGTGSLAANYDAVVASILPMK